MSADRDERERQRDEEMWREFPDAPAPDPAIHAKAECCHGVDDVCVASGCLMGILGGEHG